MPRGAECCSAHCTHLNCSIMASSSSRPLSLLAKGSYISQVALANVLESVREDPSILEEGTSRTSVKRSRDVSLTDTPFGSPLQTMSLIMDDGSSKEISYLHPLAILFYFLEMSVSFKEFFNSRLESHTGCWNLIMYGDEVTPGQTLKKGNTRKIWALYWSFKELHGLSICKIVFFDFVSCVLSGQVLNTCMRR